MQDSQIDFTRMACILNLAHFIQLKMWVLQMIVLQKKYTDSTHS